MEDEVDYWSKLVGKDKVLAVVHVTSTCALQSPHCQEKRSGGGATGSKGHQCNRVKGYQLLTFQAVHALHLATIAVAMKPHPQVDRSIAGHQGTGRDNTKIRFNPKAGFGV